MNNLDYYGPEIAERRERFNKIINNIDMVLMNNIPSVDLTVLENWQDKTPFDPDCEVIDIANVIGNIKKQAASEGQDYYCQYHEYLTSSPDQCSQATNREVYQWFAVNDNDADFLQRHNQYVTYSVLLDTYFLAICHLGTSWDYEDSMVDDILGDRQEQE